MIVTGKENKLFTLHTQNTTYQMKADEQGVLLHTYYGPRVEDSDLSYLIRRADRGFSPSPSRAGNDRTYSLDTLPQEFSSCGVGDFRLPSIEVEQADGSRMTDLRVTGWEKERGKYSLDADGLPSFFGGEEAETLRICLEDAVSGVVVKLSYGVFGDCDLITRSVEVQNQGNAPIRLRQCASLCLDFQRGDLDLITFDGRHAMERALSRSPLRPGLQGVNSTRGMSSHQHNPFVVLCERDANEDFGLCFGAMLVYSGNFQAMAERSQFEDTRLVMGIDPYQFCWTLAPGETFTAPEAALVCSPCGFGQMSRQFHRAIREHLIHDPLQGRRRPVLINNWEATFFDFTADRLVDFAKTAAPLGIELLVMDDGWFGRRNSDNSGLGDWWVNEDKLPGGLEALAPRIKELGMSFGLWVEPEMVNEDSELYRVHPDWALGAPGRSQTRGRNQLALDFSRPEVRDYIYDSLRKVLDSAEVAYLKWDMNRSLTDVWSASLPAGRQGEVSHRYVLGVYDFLRRLRRDYPGMFIEGCAGGGGRFDAGMLCYTPQIWCSDNTDAMDRLRIQYGTSFCYPPETMGAHVSAVPNQQTGHTVSLETRGVVAMSGTFGYEMDVGHCSPEEKETIKAQVERYKSVFRLVQEGDYYRLSDPFTAPYTAWAHVSPDRREALVSVVTGTVHAAEPFRALRLKGLDPAARYRVNGSEVYSGAALMNAGYPLPCLTGDYQSLQLHLAAE